jgi:hypothetical protein
VDYSLGIIYAFNNGIASNTGTVGLGLHRDSETNESSLFCSLLFGGFRQRSVCIHLVEKSQPEWTSI